MSAEVIASVAVAVSVRPALPALALAVRLTVYWSRFGVLPPEGDQVAVEFAAERLR